MQTSPLWRSLCAVSLFPLVFAQRYGLVQRAVPSSTSLEQAAPTPLSISASQNWDGPDGPWSSFTIRVGTPEQDVRVLISTASQQTWVILPQGCLLTDPTCRDARGRVFNYNTSSTWTQLDGGYFEISIEGNLNLGNVNLSANAFYGHDTISLGGEGSGGPTLPDQIVGGIGTEKYYLGLFGVNPKVTNFTTKNGYLESPSYLASLRNKSLIPSVSFGYTAGAQYRLKKVLGSLTLGGYDESRFTPNDLSFSFAPDNSRDLVLGIQSIVSTRPNGTDKPLLTAGILAYVDSTVPEIWLPIEACQAFEEAFGLVYDEESKLYPVNDTLHDALIAQNASITFVLGQLQTGGKTINITLPYASFDLQATPPFVKKKTKYFPLQRAQNDTQYTLGRTFLQEAYLIVDWERGNFSVSQCSFVDGAPQKIVAIAAPSKSSNAPVTSNPRSSSPAKKIGIGVGVALAVVFVAAIFWFIFYRRRKQQNKPGETKNPDADAAEVLGTRYEKAELNTDNEHAIHEKGDGDSDRRQGQPKGLASRRSWARDDELLSGGTSAVGELSAERGTGGLSPSDPLLGQVHELHGRPDSFAAPIELPAEQLSELPGSSPRKSQRELTESSADPSSPVSHPGSSAPSSPGYGHWGLRRGTGSSARRSLLSPSSPSQPPGDRSSPETEGFNSVSLADDQERGRGHSGLFSFLRAKGISRGGRSTRET